MYFNNLKDALIQLMKEANKQKIDKFKQELKDVKQALVSAIASPDADKKAEE
jgi:acylphosphatase